MAGYTRQSSYTDGDIINAADSNDEFDQLVNVFNNTTGHKHDGTAGEGPVIGLIGDPGVVTPINKVVVDDTNNRVGFFVDVASISTEQVRVQDGAIVPVTDDDVDLGAVGAEFKNLYIDGTANIDSFVLGTSTAVTSVDTDLTSVSASDDTLASAKAIKTYVDAQVTAQDLDFQADTGGALNIDLDSETLTLTGGTGIDTAGSGNTVTFAIDSTVATLTGTQTLTNKTINADNNTVTNLEVDNLKAGVLDTDLTSVAATDTTLPSAKAVKTYVDSQVTAQDLDFQADTGGALSIDLDSEVMTFTGGTGIDTSGSGNAVTFAIDSTVATLTGTQTLTNKSIDASQLTGTVANARLDQQLQDVAGLTPTDGNFIVGNGTNFVSESGSTVRTSLGLGSIATQNANSVSISGGSITGITDLAIADGGTAASTASGARTNLGLVIGTDVQAYDAGLTSIAGLTTAADQIVYTTGSDTYAVSSITAFGRSLVDDADAATARTTLGLGTAATSASTDFATAAQGALADTALQNVVEDTTPQLGGSLDLNSQTINGTGTINITGSVTATSFTGDGSGLTNLNIVETDPSALAFAIALG